MKILILSLLMVSGVNVFAREGHEGSFLEFRRERFAVQQIQNDTSKEAKSAISAPIEDVGKKTVNKRSCC